MLADGRERVRGWWQCGSVGWQGARGRLLVDNTGLRRSACIAGAGGNGSGLARVVLVLAVADLALPGCWGGVPPGCRCWLLNVRLPSLLN